jgi:LysR family transcriptional regulator, regulator of gene expression of beta-lactamase
LARKLPSLNGLRAFEAAGRNGSFAIAAKELNVSSAAVSRLVRVLEARLGFALFKRHANRLNLTPRGKALLGGLTNAFDAIAQLTDQVVGMQSPHVLTVGVGPAFALGWLIPRLSGFHKSHPDIEVRLATGGTTLPLQRDWSCAIRREPPSSHVNLTDNLFPSEVVPVCSPALAAQLSSIGDLGRIPLIRISTMPDDWPLWLDAARADRIEAKPGDMIFESNSMAIEAAFNGVGLAVAQLPCVIDALNAGRLVAPFPMVAKKAQRWILEYQPTRVKEAALVAFRQWLKREALKHRNAARHFHL